MDTEGRISLCVIVRDEEKVLPRMFASVRDLLTEHDEIVVVDTGSTDRTVEIAKQAGARVIAHAFDDDFAAARNVGLAAARCPWILVLDADEQLLPGSADAIRRATHPGNDDRLAGAYLTFRNDLGGGREHVCGILRLFRNDPAVRFRFRIHEQVVETVEELARARGLRMATLEDAVVLHDGYRPEHRKARDKDARNERLFRKQLADQPDCPYAWYKFGDFLRRFDDDRKREAIEALERSAALVRALPPDQIRALAYPAEVAALLALELDARGDTDQALAVAEDGRRRCADSPNLEYVLAYLYARLAKHRESFRAYARLRTFDGKVLAVPPEPGVTGANAFLGMGLALANLRHVNAARSCLEHAVRSCQVGVEKYEATAVKAHVALARLQLAAGALDEAACSYGAALRLEPGRQDIRLRLGALLVHAGLGAEAEREYAAAHEFGASIEHIATGLAAARMLQGDLEAAYEWLSHVSDDPDAQVGRTLLERVATGDNPWEESSFNTPSGRRWLKRLEQGLRPVQDRVER